MEKENIIILFESRMAYNGMVIRKNRMIGSGRIFGT